MAPLRSGLLFGIFLIVVTDAVAQLGSKDGAGLPPANLARVSVGSRAPDFTLMSSKGIKISLSDSIGKDNVVLVFYRGHW